MKIYNLFIISESLEYRIVCRNFLDKSQEPKYKISEFNCAKKSLESILYNLPELIILDYSLPDISALEFLEKLKSIAKNKLVAVIVLSAQGNESTAVEIMKNGAWDYLIKPRLTSEALNRSVHTAIQKLSLMQQIEQQREQQQLLAAIALRIRQSLSLDTVLNTAVEEIRNFLGTDRVLVYQFCSNEIGTIVAESTLPGWKKLLNLHLENSFFYNDNSYFYQENNQDIYHLRKQATENIYEAGFSQPHVEMLESFQVQANLIVTILSCDDSINTNNSSIQNGEGIWGLLIAHQCSGIREWKKEEIDLLEQLSVQLAIAIRQAELYENLQSLNNQLEVKVEERTQKLQQSERQLCLLNQELEVRVQERTNDLKQLNIKLRHEICKRQKIADDLYESETNFRQLAENIHQVFFIYNYDASKLIYISPVYEEIWGRSCDEIYKSTSIWLDSVHPEDKEALSKVLLEQLHTDGLQHEYRIIRNDGEIRWILRRTFLVRDEEGQIQKIVGIAEDISDRKQSEAKLQQRQQEFIALVENAPNVIARIDRDLRYLYVNPAIQEVIGLPQESFLGKNYRELGFSEANFAVFEELACLVFATGEERITELTLDGKQGIRYHQARLVPERNFQGDVVSILVVSTDITLIKLAEIELRETNALLKAIIHSAPVGINLVDSQGKIVLWNPMSESIFGWSAEEIINKPLSVIEDEQVFLDNLSRSQPHQQDNQIETFRRHKDGKMLEISLSSALVKDDRGKIIGSIDITQDISEQQAALKEREIREKQIQRSLEEKETLLKEIHHRVKNNLQIISSLLRMQSRRILDEKTLILFQEAQNRVQSMALIHEQLYQSNDISQIDFGEYIRSLTNNLFRCYGINEKKINIHIETNNVQLNLDNAIPCGLIINELVSNSLKYAFPNDNKGEINITIESDIDKNIVLNVNDDGIGISNDMEWEKSNSLGLKIVRSLSRQLKGEISLNCLQGTDFKVIFPKSLL
ncbi:MAG: PAS domain S-box protein [Mastigocoleus sp.]